MDVKRWLDQLSHTPLPFELSFIEDGKKTAHEQIVATGRGDIVAGEDKSFMVIERSNPQWMDPDIRRIWGRSQEGPMDQQPKVLGKWTRAMRCEKGLTQGQIAERSDGVFQLRDVRQIEQGRLGILRPDRLEYLLQTLDLDFGSLRQMRFDQTPITVRIPQSFFAATRIDSLHSLAANRERLHHAIGRVHLTCQRTTELMTASKRFARTCAA